MSIADEPLDEVAADEAFTDGDEEVHYLKEDGQSTKMAGIESHCGMVQSIVPASEL